MPRPLRLEFTDAWYHVMNRGANHRNIFHSTKYRSIFLDLLGEASSIFGIEIHAYCLMDNHYHLLIKTPQANLSRAMRHINGVYTQHYNRLAKNDGPLFRGRYKAIVIENNESLLQVSRYIHLNPIDAKLTKSLEQYLWSSYPSYVQKKSSYDWLHTKMLFSIMNTKNAKDAYKVFVEAGLDQETFNFYQREKTPVIFGSVLFKDQLLKKIEDKKRKASSTDIRRTQTLPTIFRVEQVCAAYFQVKKRDLHSSRHGQENMARKIAMYGCRIWASEKLEIIAEYFGSSANSVSNTIRQIKKRIKLDKSLAMNCSEIQKEVCCLDI